MISFHYFHAFLYAMCLFCTSFSFGQAGSTAGGHFVNSFVDSIPKYVSGEFGFVDYLTGNFRLSQSIKTQSTGVESILLSFEVNVDGTTSDVTVENSSNAYLANEFRRLCTNTYGWSPAMLYGSPVKSRVFIPFSFTMEGDQILYLPHDDLLVARPKEEKAIILKAILGTVIISPLAVVFGKFLHGVLTN